MSHETTTAIADNLTANPEQRSTGSDGRATHLTAACTSRVQDRTSGAWRDGDTLFPRCTVWRRILEQVAASLRMGTRVVLVGRLHQQTCESDDEQKRAIELVAGRGDRVATTRDRPRRTVAGAHGRRPSRGADTPADREATPMTEGGGTA